MSRRIEIIANIDDDHKKRGNMGIERTLDEVDRGVEVSVLEIQGGWGIRHRLNKMGIHPGDRVVIRRSAVMGGPILIKVHGMEVALGRGMARKVLISNTNEDKESE